MARTGSNKGRTKSAVPTRPPPRKKRPATPLVAAGVLAVALAGVYTYTSSPSLRARLSPTTKPHHPATSSDGPKYHHLPLHAAAGSRRTRLVAVGDLHGDLPNARQVLHMAGVTDEFGTWSGGADVFVQTGDIVDRGDDTIALYGWMEELRVQAESVGGRVLSHLGNHEVMNAIGDWRYVPQTEIKTFGGVAARQKELSSGRIGRAWAANYTTTSRVPLHPSLGEPNEDYPFQPGSQSSLLPSPLSHAAYSFVHGGLAPTYPYLQPFPSAINALGKGLLHKLQTRDAVPPHPPNPYPGLPNDATEDEHALYDTGGPYWYRGWALAPEQDVCAAVDGVLQRTGTRRMVMGHTPDFEKVVSRCDGKILIIDTGISHAYGGVLAALAVEYELVPQLDGKWVEREVVEAIYPNKRVLFVDETREVPAPGV